MTASGPHWERSPFFFLNCPKHQASFGHCWGEGYQQLGAGGTRLLNLVLTRCCIKLSCMSHVGFSCSSASGEQVETVGPVDMKNVVPNTEPVTLISVRGKSWGAGGDLGLCGEARRALQKKGTIIEQPSWQVPPKVTSNPNQPRLIFF